MRAIEALPLAVALGSALAVLTATVDASAEGALRTVLVIDASSSMRSTDPKELRKVAAELFVDLTREGDSLAVAGFDGGARDAMTGFVTVRSSADREAVKRAVRAVGNDGAWTDFTAGLEGARRLFASAPREAGDQDLIVFLTDGRCDPDPKGPLAEAARAAKVRAEELCQKRVLDEILPALGKTRVYAVGLSKSAPRAFLEQLGGKTGGLGVATDRADELPRTFADIYARLFGSRLAEGPSAATQTLAIDEGALSLGVVLVGPPKLSVRLFDPAGAELPTDNKDPAAVSFVDGPAYRLYRVARPLAGPYRLDVGGGGTGGRYAVLQNLDLDLGFVDHPQVLEVGKPRALRFRLATPGGKVPPAAFLDRHAFALAMAESPGTCDDAAFSSGAPLPLRRIEGGGFEATVTPAKNGALCLEARMTPGEGGVLTRTRRAPAVRVIPPIHLKAAVASPFGAVKQEGKGQAAISLEGSEIGEVLGADLEFEGLPPFASSSPAKVELGPAGPGRISVDLHVGRDTPPGPREIAIRIVPRSPEGFTDRAVGVRIPVTIVPLTFWERYGRTIQLVGAALTTLLLVLGIVLPARFRRTAVLHCEDRRDPDLPRQTKFPLGTRARAGFYRSATLLLGPTGPVRRGGVLELRAGPGGAVLGQPMGGRRVRELPREGEFGASEEGREVRLVKGRFRAMPGVRYEVEGTGLVFSWTPR
ncbi:vWA domain-containing protein [Polyangium aurulentum]|uniref:vWA domain-containing protein n=1 Tax=Polyangium aurulentum TaxID=2567896 RepID=UPI0010AE23A7|nr:vWA domain-containing protein [Polyangium aurulentum]UQA59048.1 VWA domain-containing protein [Polyangium aurulentum]